MGKVLKIVLIFFFTLFFVGVAGIYLLFHAEYWENYFIDFANKQLSRNGIKFVTHGVKGSVFTGLEFKGVEFFSVADGRLLFSAGHLTVRYKLFSLFKKHPEIGSLVLDSVRVFFPHVLNLPSESKGSAVASGGSGKGVKVERVKINDAVVISEKGRWIDSCYVDGGLKLFGDSLCVYVKNAWARLVEYGEFVEVKNSRLSYRAGRVYLGEFSFRNRSTTGDIRGFYNSQLSRGNFLMKLNNVVFSERFTGLGRYFDRGDRLNCEIKVLLDTGSVYVRGKFHGLYLGKAVEQGVIEAWVTPDRIKVDTISIKSGGEWISGKGVVIRDDTLVTELVLSGYDASRLLGIDDRVCVTGKVGFDAGKLEGYLPQEFFVDFQFDTIGYNQYEVYQVKGAAVYNGEIITLVDSLSFFSSGNYASIIGGYSPSSREISVEGFIEINELSGYAKYLGVKELAGSGTVFVGVSGDIFNPDVKGWARLDSLCTEHFDIRGFLGRFGSIYTALGRIGNIDIEFSQARLNAIDRNIPPATMEAHIKGDTVYIDDFQFSENNKKARLRGKLIGMHEFFLDELSADYYGTRLVNLSPVVVNFSNDTLRLSQTSLMVDTGKVVVQSEFCRGKGLDLRLSTYGLDLSEVRKFFPQLGRFKGVLDSDLSLSFSGDERVAQGHFVIKDFQFNGEVYNKVDGRFRYSKDAFIVEDLKLFDRSRGVLSVSGRIRGFQQVAKSAEFFTGLDSIRAAVSFDSFDVSYLDPVFFKGTKKGGKLYGRMIFHGSLGKPLFDFDLVVANPVFDKLDGDTLMLVGKYEGGDIVFRKIRLLDGKDIYKGYGYLPYKVSFYPFIIELQRDSTLDVNIVGHTSTLEFLTRYGGIFDDIQGDFGLAMNISNTPSSLTYNGNMNIREASVSLSFLENRITGVKGSGILKNNVIDIVGLTGYTRKRESYKLSGGLWRRAVNFVKGVLGFRSEESGLPNISITGSIDVSDLFSPYLNLNIDGKDLYVRTFLGEYEGILDGTLRMRGSDTLFIEGDINNKELVIRSEFLKSEPSAFGGMDNVVLNIHINFPANLYIKNSQLDCQMEGELYITKDVGEPIELSGELHTRRGNFYYLGYKFVIEKGDIYFDPSLGSPQVDVLAGVNIAVPDTVSGERKYTSEYVRVELTGELDNPTLQFISDKYSEADIIRYLARVQTFTNGYPIQEQVTQEALNVFGAYFERLIERQISRLGIVDNIEIRTGGLLSPGLGPDQWTLMLSRRLRSNLFLTYERSLSLTEPFQTFEIEYFISPNFSIVGNVDSEGLIHIRYKYKFRY